MICLGQGGLQSPRVWLRTGRRVIFYKNLFSALLCCYLFIIIYVFIHSFILYLCCRRLPEMRHKTRSKVINPQACHINNNNSNNSNNNNKLIGCRKITGLHNKRAGLHNKPAGHHNKPPGHHNKLAGHNSKPPGHHSKPPGHHSKPAGHRNKPPGHCNNPAGYCNNPAGHYNKPAGHCNKPAGHHHKLLEVPIGPNQHTFNHKTNRKKGQ